MIYNSVLLCSVLLSVLFCSALGLQSTITLSSPTATSTGSSSFCAPDLQPLDTLTKDMLDSALMDVNDLAANEFGKLPYLTALSFAVGYKGDILYSDNFGVVNLDTNVEPTQDTPYPIASVTKVFVSLTAFILADTGVVDCLDDPISKYVTDRKNWQFLNPFGEDQPTIRQIISQLGGLTREAPCLQPHCDETHDTMMQRLNNSALEFAPGSYPSYSNLGFDIVARVLLQYGFPGLSWEEWAMDNIVKPLGLKNTGFIYTDAVNEVLCQSYLDGILYPNFAEDAGWDGPCGEAYSTTYDLTIMSQALIKGSLLSNPGLAKSMLEPLFWNTDGATGFGAPWELYREPTTGYLVRRKGGNLGYSSLMSFVPDLELSLTVLWSSTADEFGFSEEAYGILLPAIVEALTPLQTVPKMPNNVTSYLGSFLDDSGINTGYVSIVTNDQIYNETVLLLVMQAYAGAPATTLLLQQSKVNKRTLQIVLPRELESCIGQELLALNGQYVYFTEKNSLGEYQALSIPGYIYGPHYAKVETLEDVGHLL